MSISCGPTRVLPVEGVVPEGPEHTGGICGTEALLSAKLCPVHHELDRGPRRRSGGPRCGCRQALGAPPQIVLGPGRVPSVPWRPGAGWPPAPSRPQQQLTQRHNELPCVNLPLRVATITDGLGAQLDGLRPPMGSHRRLRRKGGAPETWGSIEVLRVMAGGSTSDESDASWEGKVTQACVDRR